LNPFKIIFFCLKIRPNCPFVPKVEKQKAALQRRLSFGTGIFNDSNFHIPPKNEAGEINLVSLI
jgi:hypothetical protein